jgi:proline iminopeptidase
MGIRSTGSAAGIPPASPRCTARWSRVARQVSGGFFDPHLYRAVLLDQRGSGRSRPPANEPDADLNSNTTPHLIVDIEALREMCGVDRWTILGLSWGTTLGLAYAQAYPHRVNALVLGFVTTTSRREVQWITEDVGRIFPREWDRFANAVPAHLRHLRLVDAYATMLADPDPTVRDKAAREWCTWEEAHVSLAPGHTPNPRYRDPEFRLRFAGWLRIIGGMRPSLRRANSSATLLN